METFNNDDTWSITDNHSGGTSANAGNVINKQRFKDILTGVGYPSTDAYDPVSYGGSTITINLDLHDTFQVSGLVIYFTKTYVLASEYFEVRVNPLGDDLTTSKHCTRLKVGQVTDVLPGTPLVCDEGPLLGRYVFLDIPTLGLLPQSLKFYQISVTTVGGAPFKRKLGCSCKTLLGACAW